jgi:hypothetical protein
MLILVNVVRHSRLELVLTTNQDPFIAQVSVILYGLGYESAKYFLYQGLYNINLD